MVTIHCSSKHLLNILNSARSYAPVRSFSSFYSKQYLFEPNYCNKPDLKSKPRNMHYDYNIYSRQKFLKMLDSSHGLNMSAKSSPDLDPVVKRLLVGLLSGQRAALAESITLVETSSPKKKILAKQLLSSVLQSFKNKKPPNSPNNIFSFRIGLSGPPGAGKSTFIECLGNFLTRMDLRVAVLAVDPSSATTGGSILGDKTRMPELSKNPNAFIRPSPSRGHLGGVTRSTNEAIVLCEAAGYDVILVETIGVGQSEYAVADMVDIFSLLLPPGSGDELQGIKRGIMELSDIVIVNKSDGDLIEASMRVQYEYISALKFLQPRNKNWKPVVKRVSSINGEGIQELWKTVLKFREIMETNGDLQRKRAYQQKAWMRTHLRDNIISTFLEMPSIHHKIKDYENKVMNGVISPGDAADRILYYIKKEINKNPL